MFDIVLLMMNFVYLVLFDVPIAFLVALFKRKIIPDFNNDIVLITGAAQGIGKELAIKVQYIMWRDSRGDIMIIVF